MGKGVLPILAEWRSLATENVLQHGPATLGDGLEAGVEAAGMTVIADNQYGDVGEMEGLG